MNQQKIFSVARLLIQYGFLTFGLFYQNWSLMFIFFGLWMEGLVRLLFTNILVLVSNGSGKLKFLLVHSLTFILAQMAHFVFLLVFAFFLLDKDPFLWNFFQMFGFFDIENFNEIVGIILFENANIISVQAFQKDILQVFLVLCLSYVGPTIMEIFQLRKNKQEWKDANVSLSSFVKVHISIVVLGIILFFVQVPLIVVTSIFLAITFALDLLAIVKRSNQTLEQFMQRKKNKQITSSVK